MSDTLQFFLFVCFVSLPSCNIFHSLSLWTVIASMSEGTLVFHSPLSAFLLPDWHLLLLVCVPLHSAVEENKMGAGSFSSAAMTTELKGAGKDGSVRNNSVDSVPVRLSEPTRAALCSPSKQKQYWQDAIVESTHNTTQQPSIHLDMIRLNVTSKWSA